MDGGKSRRNWKTLQFVSKVRSNLHYFLYVVYGKEVDSGIRKLNFTHNFDIGHKRYYHCKLTQTLYFAVYIVASLGKIAKALQFVSKARSNFDYFLNLAY